MSPAPRPPVPDPPAWFLACVQAHHDFNVLHAHTRIVFQCATCQREEAIARVPRDAA